MEIITKDSDAKFANFLSIVQQDPTLWMCVHINMASINDEIFDVEGISLKILEKIRAASFRLAEKIFQLGLDQWEGKIFCFYDGDIVAIAKCPEISRAGIVAILDEEFATRKLQPIVRHYPMKEKLADLLALSTEKKESAEDYQSQMQAMDTAEKVFAMVSANADLTRDILKKRRQRHGKVILIIEDDIVTRALITAALRDYRVIQAKDAKCGIAAYINHAPNVVLLDIHLPDHSGHEVLDKLKLLDPKACVVMLSADSASDNVISTHAKGSAGFIKKPFSKERIVESVEKFSNQIKIA